MTTTIDTPTAPAVVATKTPAKKTTTATNKAGTVKPGDPRYDWAPHYDGADLYTHTFADGTVVAIRTFAAIYSKTWLYKIRDLTSDTDIEFAAIDRAACPTAHEVLLSLDDTHGDPIDELWTAWIAAGTKHADNGDGLTPGKSSG